MKYNKSNELKLEKKDLLNLLLNKGALRLASSMNDVFILKSGRKSPYFINIGALTDGESLNKLKQILARFIASLIKEGKIDLNPEE